MSEIDYQSVQEYLTSLVPPREPELKQMEEIAETQAAAGLTPDLFRALATVYGELAERRVAETPEDVRDDLPLADVLDRLSAEGGAPAAAADPSRDA